jgi:HD superfamily phosphohydrolase
MKASEILNLDADDRKKIEIAAFLHDIGHGPFSHTLEFILRDSLNVDHVDLTEGLINGDHVIFDYDEKEIVEPFSVYEILVRHNIDQKEISDIVRGANKEKMYLGNLLNSSIDVDQLDYLIRDSYYTGVAYGLIDIDRYLQSLEIRDNTLILNKKGVSSVENILMARALMYSQVYFHKTVRIAELMLSKAIELNEEKQPFDFFKMTDAEIINELKKMGKFQHEIAIRLKYRRLFKKVYSLDIYEIDNEKKKKIKDFEDLKTRSEFERKLESELDIPRGHIIIDVPYKEIHQSEPRIQLNDLFVNDSGSIKRLDDCTTVTKAIRTKFIPDWYFMVITDEKNREKLDKKIDSILFE